VVQIRYYRSNNVTIDFFTCVSVEVYLFIYNNIWYLMAPVWVAYTISATLI
jgi:hypothetical protein